MLDFGLKQISRHNNENTDLTHQLINEKIFKPIFAKGDTGEKVFKALKQVFSWMYRTEMIDGNMFSDVKKLDYGIKKKKAIKALNGKESNGKTLTTDQVKEVLNFLDEGEHKISAEMICLIKLLFFTGLRTHEVMQATWDEIKWERNLWPSPGND